MSLDPGIAAASLGACGVVIAAIVKFGPSKRTYVSNELFDERTGAIAQSLKRIETKLDAHIERDMER